MKPYYVLNIFIDSNDNTLHHLYSKNIKKHNMNVNNFINNDNDGTFCFDAGFDLLSPIGYLFQPHFSSLIDHNIKCNMLFINNEKSHYVGYHLYPRSSTGSKTPLRLSNSVGIIDSGYRGNIMASFDNFTNDVYYVEKYDRLVQICPPNMTYPIFVNKIYNQELLGDSIRGNSGFGSSGK